MKWLTNKSMNWTEIQQIEYIICYHECANVVEFNRERVKERKSRSSEFTSE